MSSTCFPADVFFLTQLSIRQRLVKAAQKVEGYLHSPFQPVTQRRPFTTENHDTKGLNTHTLPLLAISVNTDLLLAQKAVFVHQPSNDLPFWKIAPLCSISRATSKEELIVSDFSVTTAPRQLSELHMRSRKKSP